LPESRPNIRLYLRDLRHQILLYVATSKTPTSLLTKLAAAARKLALSGANSA
jgi:hypothetical protein